MSATYVFGRTVSVSYEDTLERATSALAAEGFGVLTEIDVAAMLKKKLGWDMPSYKTVGIMDPDSVLRLVERPEIGAIARQVRERLERVLAAL